MLLSADLVSSLQLARVLCPTASSPLHPQAAHAHHHAASSPQAASSAFSSYCSLDWDSSGEWAVLVSSPDDNLLLLSADSGSVAGALHCKGWQCSVVRFSHHHRCVIVASASSAIRYLSLHDSRVLRSFAGHTSAITALSLSPVDDGFLSASADLSIRLWDLRSAACRGLLRCDGAADSAARPPFSSSASPSPSVAFDPQGLIFAVCWRNAVKLYDQRSYTAGPFSTFTLPDELSSGGGAPAAAASSSSLMFAPDGQTLLLNSAAQPGRLLLLDAFDGRVRRLFDTKTAAAPPSSPPHGQSLSHLPAAPSFSPDAALVFAGAADGSFHVFDKEAEEEDEDEAAAAASSPLHRPVEARLVFRGHNSAVRCVAMSPTRLCLISAATEIAWWLPPPEAVKGDSTAAARG